MFFLCAEKKGECLTRNVFEMPTKEEAQHGYTHDNQNEDEDLE